MELTFVDFIYIIGTCLEGFFFGLYSGIFALYLQHHGSQQSAGRAKNIVFYALWVLYALSAATIIVEILNFDLYLNIVVDHRVLGIIEIAVFACCDFIAQFILIYRCWIMWGCSIRVVIVPSFLAFSFLAIWIVSGTTPMLISEGDFYILGRGSPLEVTGLALSMTVNGLVTGLIVFRILKLSQEVKTSTANDQILGVTNGSTLQRVIFILIESDMALFSIQLARLVASTMLTNPAEITLDLMISIHNMLNGITPTIILVRVSMGLSFHDEGSMVEANIGSLRFSPNIPNSISETGEINIVDEERRNDDVEILLIDDSDIQMVDR